MMKEKERLKNQLFNGYLEESEGILATDLTEKLAIIPTAYQNLHKMCEKNIRFFDSTSRLEGFKMLEHKQRKYLILKIRMLKYVIIDIESRSHIIQSNLEKYFDESFFKINFNEKRIGPKFSKMYTLERYKGDILELIDFYLKNQNIFNLSTELHYNINEKNAWTYFYISFANSEAQLGFMTEDQFLFEQIFLKYDFTPSRTQDAISSMGLETFNEIVGKIKEIKIPEKFIPTDLLNQYKIEKNSLKRNLKKEFKNNK